MSVARKVGHRVATRLVQQHDIFAVGDPLVAEPHPHPAPQRLGEQQPLGQRLWGQEVPDRPGGQRALLPCQSHVVSFVDSSAAVRPL